jgi:PKD repeat protein
MTKSILLSLAGALLSILSNACPTSLIAVEQSCGNYVFYLTETPVGNVIWDFGDGNTTTGSIEIQHDFANDGVYVVSAQFSGPECPETLTLLATVEVNCGLEECPAFIHVEEVDCDSYIFSLDGVESGDVAWDFGDGATESSSVVADHTFASNGVYIVTAVYNGVACPMAWTNVVTIQVNCTPEVECPTEIWSGAGAECGVMNFEIGSFVEGENVIWYPGDESGAVEGGHFFSHTYANPGSYTVCAFYTTPLCPNGVELCTTISVEPCNTELCPTGISAEEIDCDTYVLQIQGIDNAEVNWTFEDGTSISGGITAEHTWPENGIFIVTAEVFAPQCPIMPPTNIITFVYTVQIDCGTAPECPTEIWSGAAAECGVMNFEVGSFVEGENVIWYPGDESGAVEGGHFFSHTYENPGSYNVCAFYTTPLCPDGVELCTTISVEPCEQPCNEIGFGIDSYLLEGGTPWLTYMISNAETGIMVNSGIAEYTENDPYFDTPLCLPDGCYYLSIDNNNPLMIGQGVNVFFILNSVNLIENASIVYQDEIAITYLIGINTDCAGPPSCEAAFEPIFTNTPGHIEFINNSTFSGVAEFLWEYGNGTISDGQTGNVQYESNGVYTVCLTVTTGNCTNTTCQVIVVDNMDTPCEFNEVTLFVQAQYFEPINEIFQVVITNGLLVVDELVFETSGNLNDTLEFCVPDGCYGVSLSSELPIQALSFLCTFTGENTQQLGELQLSIGENSTSAVVGVNMDCTIEVEESNSARVNAFPNPASDNIQFVSEEMIQFVEIFDVTGKHVASFSPNQKQVQINTSTWSTGLYVAHVMSAGKMERVIFDIAR